jgi:hypothetical protein
MGALTDGRYVLDGQVLIGAAVCALFPHIFTGDSHQIKVAQQRGDFNWLSYYT